MATQAPYDNPDTKKRLNKVVTKLDKIVEMDESNVLLQKLEGIVAKKKEIDRKRQKEYYDEITYVLQFPTGKNINEV
jgi:hypothetical protein